MSDYKSRMLDERDQLKDKFDKLSKFITTDAFDGLSDLDQELLRTQKEAMDIYLGVLQIRINRSL